MAQRTSPQSPFLDRQPAWLKDVTPPKLEPWQKRVGEALAAWLVRQEQQKRLLSKNDCITEKGHTVAESGVSTHSADRKGSFE